MLPLHCSQFLWPHALISMAIHGDLLVAEHGEPFLGILISTEGKNILYLFHTTVLYLAVGSRGKRARLFAVWVSTDGSGCHYIGVGQGALVCVWACGSLSSKLVLALVGCVPLSKVTQAPLAMTLLQKTFQAYLPVGPALLAMAPQVWRVSYLVPWHGLPMTTKAPNFQGSNRPQQSPDGPSKVSHAPQAPNFWISAIWQPPDPMGWLCPPPLPSSSCPPKPQTFQHHLPGSPKLDSWLYLSKPWIC